MPQSLAQIYVHLIFSTKNREPFLSPDIHENLYEYIGGILRNLDSPSFSIRCVSDHIHILFMQCRKISLVEIVEKVKKSSSKWIKDKNIKFRNFHWQNGYGAFSVSASRLNAVKKYVMNQTENHKKISFEDEFTRFLKEYNVMYDERYVFD